MKFTRKKKQEFMSNNIVNAHALAKALGYSLKFVKENNSMIEDEGLKDSVKQLTAKLNYFQLQIEKMFATDSRA